MSVCLVEENITSLQLQPVHQIVQSKSQTMKYSQLLAIGFAASVDAHGYLTIPKSRTRLGAEVCTVSLSNFLTDSKGRHRLLP